MILAVSFFFITSARSFCHGRRKRDGQATEILVRRLQPRHPTLQGLQSTHGGQRQTAPGHCSRPGESEVNGNILDFILTLAITMATFIIKLLDSTVLQT